MDEDGATTEYKTIEEAFKKNLFPQVFTTKRDALLADDYRSEKEYRPWNENEKGRMLKMEPTIMFEYLNWARKDQRYYRNDELQSIVLEYQRTVSIISHTYYCYN